MKEKRMNYTHQFMNNACNNQMKQTNNTDAQLGFMTNTCTDQVRQITLQEINDFIQLIKTYVGTDDEIEMTLEIKNQLIDAVMTNTPLDAIAKRIANGIITHNKLLLKLERCNRPQDRVLTQKDGRTQKGLVNTQALRNTHYNTYMNQRTRFRRET